MTSRFSNGLAKVPRVGTTKETGVFLRRGGRSMKMTPVIQLKMGPGELGSLKAP